MRKVKLTAITRKALTRLKQHGNIWDVVSIDDTQVIVRSERETFQVGPNQFEPDWRVVKFHHDPHFNIEWLKEEIRACTSTCGKESELRTTDDR